MAVVVYSAVSALWLPWYTYLFFDWLPITVTYCSLIFSSCGIILDLLHVLNCDPESRIWRGPGGVLSEEEGGRGKKSFFQFLRFYVFSPPPCIILFGDKRMRDLE